MISTVTIQIDVPRLSPVCEFDQAVESLSKMINRCPTFWYTSTKYFPAQVFSLSCHENKTTQNASVNVPDLWFTYAVCALLIIINIRTLYLRLLLLFNLTRVSGRVWMRDSYDGTTV
jgi:hypothetical protein